MATPLSRGTVRCNLEIAARRMGVNPLTEFGLAGRLAMQLLLPRHILPVSG